MSIVIQVDKISKMIECNEILHNVNFRIRKGETVVFLDQGNGVKTVLFQLLCGELTPEDGTISFRGEALGKFSEIPLDVGIAIHPMGFIKEFNGYKNLKYIAGINGKVEDSEIYESMKLVGLKPESRTKVGDFSPRMLQKLSIAQAIMEKQDIVIFDELFSSENQKNHREIRRILQLLKERNITILITSDKIEYVDAICDRVYLIKDGALIEVIRKENQKEEEYITLSTIQNKLGEACLLEC